MKNKLYHVLLLYFLKINCFVHTDTWSKIFLLFNCLCIMYIDFSMVSYLFLIKTCNNNLIKIIIKKKKKMKNKYGNILFSNRSDRFLLNSTVKMFCRFFYLVFYLEVNTKVIKYRH